MAFTPIDEEEIIDEPVAEEAKPRFIPIEDDEFFGTGGEAEAIEPVAAAPETTERVEAPKSRFTPISEEEFFGLPKPTEPIPVTGEEGFLRQAADVPLKIGESINTSLRALTDLFGADNAVSQNLTQNAEWYRSLLSAQALEDEQEIGRILQEAENEGVLDQLGAGLEAFSVAPVDFVASGIGSLATFAATGVAGRAAAVAGAARAGLTGARAAQFVQRGVQATQLATGAGMGAGIVKGEIYQSVKDEMLAQGKTEEEAKNIAMDAQSYMGKNLDQILIGAGLGTIDAFTGAEKIIGKVLTKGGLKPDASRIGNIIKNGITEAAPEFIQAAQEKFASNLALQREGVDVSLTQGVFSQGALEGLVGLGMGVGAGAIEPRIQTPPTKEEVSAAAAETQDVARRSMDVAPATASLVEGEAEQIVQSQAETPDERVARLQREAQEAAGDIELEEDVSGLPPVEPTPPVTPTPEAAVAPVEPVVAAEGMAQPPTPEVVPEASENVAAWNQIKTEFASLSEDDVKAGRGQFFAYNPDLKEEANVHDVEKKITVGPKFFEKTEAQRLEIIGHEFSHRLSDSMLKDLSAFDLADEGAFGPKNPETGKLSEGINGQDTPAENIAEAASLIITGSQEDINFLKERYPIALQKITERMIQEGYPVSDIATAALSPTPEAAPAAVEPTPVTPPVTPQLEPLRRAARAEQTEEDVAGLVDSGFVELYKGQPVLTQAGLDALPEAERPRLTPEARKIQIDTRTSEAAAEAISKNLRIGVDQIDPNVRMPAGWTLEGDVYVPPQALVPTPEVRESRREGGSTLRITADDARELQYKIGTLLENADLQSDYGITSEQAKQIYNSIPADGGNWSVPAWANQAVMGELEDQAKVLSDMADDARSENRTGEALRMNRQAKRFKQLSEGVNVVRESRMAITPQRFYSQLQRTVEAKMPNVSSPEQLKAIIDPTRGSGVKPEEVKWSGITEAIDRIASENNGRVPKEAILKYMRDEGAVKFEEVTLSEKIQITPEQNRQIQEEANRVWEQWVDEAVEEAEERGMTRGMEVDRTDVSNNLNRSWDEAESEAMRILGISEEPQTKYQEYQLPEGENYREVVMAMPSKTSNDRARAEELERKFANATITNAELQDLYYLRENADLSTIETYKSPHFKNIPNYVAHMRLNDRKDGDGKEGTFIEEIQSDLHQKAREVGYKDQNIVRQNFVSWLKSNKKELSEQEIQTQFRTQVGEEIQQWLKDQEVAAKNASAVPDAPFRKDWPIQMFKRALEQAVMSGRDWIGWTTGETQAERYDLSKQISEIAYNVDRKSLFAYDKNGEPVLVKENVTDQQITEYIGKEAAERLLNSPKRDSQGGVMQRLKGEELKVGGEGMIGFYDNILPKEVSKYVKKWGAAVEKSEIYTKNKMGTGVYVPIWRVNITPEMRQIIQEEGQAVFLRRLRGEPMVGMEPSAVEARLQELGFPTGGIIRVVNQPDADFEGRTIILDGKVTGIELNAAALKDNGAIDRVLNHEFAESANADGALNRLVERLTTKEKKEINDTITRLRYEELARSAEEAARAIETLAEAWKGRGFFTRAVARVEAWANKLGFKLTRRAAEYIAARNLADINSGFRTAYNQSINTTTEAGQEIRASRREPEAIPTFTEGTPEAATLKEMATSMAKVDAASEAKGGKPETQKISDIAANWMDQGGDERALQDAIVENTNLTPANAARVAKAIARQYDIQQSIATAFLETQTGLSVEALPEGVALPKEVDPDRPKPVMQRLFEVFMGVRVPPTKITVNEKTALKQQIRLKAAANRAAKAAQKETSDQVIEVIKAMDLRGGVRPKQVQALAKRAAKVIWTNEKSLETFADYAAKVVENANYDADLREAKAAQARAKQLSKQKKVAMGPQREMLDNISKIAVNRLDDPRMYADVVNYYLRGFKAVLSPDYVVVPDSEMTSYLSQVQGEANRNQRDLDRAVNERLAEKYGVDIDDLNSVLEAADIISQLEANENREAMDNLLTEKAIETRDGLKAYDQTPLRADQRKLVDAIMKVDPKALDAEERQRFIRITNNIIYNNQTNGAEYFASVARGQQSARAAAQDGDMIAKNKAWINLLPRLVSERMQRGWALELQSVADTFRNAFGKGAMAKVYKAMGMLDLNMGFTKANNTIDEIQEKIAEFHTKLEKKYKAAARNQDGLLAEGVAGFLIQKVPNKGETESIAQRRDLIRQDIANRRNSKEADRMAMADRIETILNQIDGEGVQAVLNNLKQTYPANHESLVWYKDTLLPQYKDFLKNFDENFNDQANNYDNPDYLPIAFSKASPSLAITKEEEQVFYDQVSLRPKQAANTIKRLDYVEIPRDRTTGAPKEIEFNLRRNAFDSLSDQINKAYTSSAWQQLASFMKTPESEVVFGGQANKDFFIERLNRLRLSRMRRGAMSRGNIERAVDSLSVISRKLGTGIALGGFYQWIKQPPDQLVTALGSGGRYDLMAQNIMPKNQKAARELLKKFSIGRRGDASSGYKYINQMEGHQNRLERYFSESKWDQVKEEGSKVADVWMAALKQSDFWAASTAWMTYYEGELNKRDIKIEDWAKEAELVDSDPARQEAAAFAEQMTDIYQGSSDPTQMATFAQSGKSGWENLMKAIFVPFNSFAIQQRMRLYSDARDVLNGEKSGVGGLTGTIGGLLLFHATKRLVLPVISGSVAGILYTLLGVDMDEPDEEKQKEEANKRWRQMQGEMLGNLLVGGTPQIIEAKFIDAMNYASYLISLQLESENILNDEGEVMSFDQYAKERSPFWRYRSFDNAMSLGMLDIGLGQAEQAILQTKMVATPEEMEMYTPEEQRLLYFSALSEWLYLMRLNDADFARIVSKARRDMMSAAKEREKELKRIREGR